VFARKVAARLYPNSLTEFTRLMESEILPWLRKQEGFLDLITLAAPNGTEVAALSFWDRKEKGNEKESVQIYDSCGYPEVLQTLGNLLRETPRVKTFDVVASTMKRVTSRPTAAYDPLQETSAPEFRTGR
jgi:hypothetical protein